MASSWCIAQVFGLGLMCSQPSVSAVDSFCSSYQRVIVNPAAADEVLKLGGETKRRVDANDILYRCACPDTSGKTWDNPVCKKLVK